MRFALSDDQIALRDSLAEMLSKECTPATVRSAWEGGRQAWQPLWRALAAMGAFQVLVPERAGGLSLGMVEAVVALEECGRVALPGPVVEQMVAAPLLAEDPALEARWMKEALAGDAVVTFGPVGDAAVRGQSGTPFAKEADLVVAEFDGRLMAVEPKEASLTEEIEWVDRSWRSAVVRPVGGVAIEEGERLGRLAFERGALGAAAFLVGLAAAMVDTTVAYVTARHQFGVPVGSFQAVKHQLADAHLAVEYARPVVWRAAWAVDHDEGDAARDVSFAKVYATRAANRAARVALQCHGAIGYSFECDLHLWMKRAWVLARQWGTVDMHRYRVARALLGADLA